MNVSESMSYELSQKLDQRGHKGQMALGYLDAIDDLMKIEDRRYRKQPQLNENQQIVLEWLKNYYKENRPFTTAFGAIRNIASKRWAFIKQNLTEDQQEYVLEVFSKWAQEQEEE